MSEPDIAAYARHSRWTDPGTLASHLDRLPPEPTALPEIVGGLVLHPFFAPRGSNTAEAALRTVPQILSAILGRDDRPLDESREPADRAIGNCRNYSLLACAVFRQHGVAARLRVGFADYFMPGCWEDHWVCEYRDGVAWKLLDAELTAEVRTRFRIAFDPADVPRDRFLSAGSAWLALRRGERDPARFGVSFLGLKGLWFAAASLMRDLAALAKEEMMVWDFWGPAREWGPRHGVPDAWLDRIDSLAAALACASTGYDAVPSVLTAHRWAALTSTVLSFPEGKPVEVALDRW